MTINQRLELPTDANHRLSARLEKQVRATELDHALEQICEVYLVFSGRRERHTP